MKFFDRVYAVLRCIPAGRVASYGQIAGLLEQPHAARTVGWALRALPPGLDVPWHRVVNARGCISIPDPRGAARQRHRLEAEGVTFGPAGCIDMERFAWEGLSELELRRILASGEEPQDAA